VLGDVATIPGVDMEIKDTEVEANTEETDPTSIPTTSDTIVEPTPEVDNDLPSYEPTDGDGPMETIVNPAVTPKIKKTRIMTQPAPTEGLRRSSRARQAPQTFVPSMKGKKYEYSATQLEGTTHDPRVVELILTQLTLKAAIKMWGDDARIAAESEMKQLHWRNSFKPI